ncbi:MAG: PD40 domain-containing protein [Candidatus Hydrogenedentes bacterium]|nr:PD40 domain-containing protein [Candidatus Hydrogenedentota bacterium]
MKRYSRSPLRPTLACMGLLLVISSFTGAPATAEDPPIAEADLQYELLLQNLGRREAIAALGPQVLHTAALIQATDRDPLDIVLRRTDALLSDLIANPTPELPALKDRLDALVLRAASVPVESLEARRALYYEACQLRRTIAFSNPLLDFDNLLFLKRHRATFNHMCDQYYGVNARPGGGLFKLAAPFDNTSAATDILSASVVESGRLAGQSLAGGSFLSPDLSWDGQQILFAYTECTEDTAHQFHTDATRGHWSQGRSFHLFKVNTDGSGLSQLTDGTWNDFDPCWMPDGRVAFISERRGGYLRCGRVCPTYTLYDMAPDGADMRCLSPHETNEWNPSVTHDGKLIYTRWDYVDRHGCVAHHPWITTPDGRDSRAVHGNFSPRKSRADMELDIRAVPGSHKYAATAAPHHGQAFGSIILVDPRVKDDDGMAPVKRVTPEVDFPESQGGAQVYGTPWPLSENYFLCAYDGRMKPEQGRQGNEDLVGNYGIYLVDAFGNRELLYRDPEISCQNPIPMRARVTPPVIPSPLPDDPTAQATVALVNVYESQTPWPEGAKIAALRVYQIIPMSVPSGEPPHEIGMRLPGEEGADSVILARYVLGTTPVEADGSAHFIVPPNVELFFQALDENGLAVQSMRSSTYLKPGERLSCNGCHEQKSAAPAITNNKPIALQRAALPLTPDVDGTNPFSYPRLVQPVLDSKCVKCHQENEKAPRLDGEVVADGAKIWTASYHSLAPDFGYWQYGNPHRTTPGKFGARASRLYALLTEGHYGVELSDEELHRLTVWLDSCSVFYGVYEKEGGAAQLRGEIVHPTLQ